MVKKEGTMIDMTKILNPDTKGVTKDEILTELKREYNLRKKFYPKWMDHRMNRKQGYQQMQRLKAAIELVEELLSQQTPEQKKLF